jgi:hypothetical protein
VYDLLPRHFAPVVRKAEAITGGKARETILLRYLQTVVAATPQQVRSLFGWQPGDVDRLVRQLAADNRLHAGVQIEGLDGQYLVSKSWFSASRVRG